jgi:hypothetical protein
MTTSAELLASFNAPAPEGQQVVDARILIPEMESALLVVLEATISEPELRTWQERQFYSSQLAVTFHVDEEEAREVTMQDKPRLFHHVRINCTDAGGFDWNNNIDLVKFFSTLGVKVYEGTGKARTYVDNPLIWAADAVGRSLMGKIVHEPVKAKDEETGEWTSFKLDSEGEPVMKNKISAIAPAA